jgi:hypothetical protein
MSRWDVQPVMVGYNTIGDTTLNLSLNERCLRMSDQGLADRAASIRERLTQLRDSL